MLRYLSIVVVAGVLAVWIPIAMAPWLIAGPRRWADKLRSRA